VSVVDADTLPAGWHKVRVADALRLQNGRAFKANEWTSEGRPIIRIQNLKSPDAAFNHFNGVLPEKFAARRGDLLYAWSGTPGTSFGAHIWDGPDAWINQHIFRVDFSDEQFDREFLKLALDVNTKAYIEQAQGGVGLAHITKQKLNDSLLPVPPLAQQRVIAAAVRAFQAKRQSSTTHIAAARRAVERFRQAVLAAACSGRLTADWRERHPDIGHAVDTVARARERRQEELGRGYMEPTANEHAADLELPDSWTAAPLGLLLESIKYGTSKRSEYNAKGVAVLRIPNVSDGRLDLSDLKFAELSDRERGDLALAPGDVLMIRSNGSPQLVGRSVLVGSEADAMTYAGYLMRLRSDRLVIDPGYLTAALSTPDLRRQIEMPLRSTSGVNNINTGEVRSLFVAVPPLPEQLEINRRVDELLELAAGLRTRIDAASKRVDRSSQAVLAKAFRGEMSG
jgi:type I restriction enzyme, S subunit